MTDDAAATRTGKNYPDGDAQACLEFEQDLQSLTDGIAQLGRFEAELAAYEATLGSPHPPH